MAVADVKTFSAWKELAAAHGLRVTEDLDLTEQIKPNLERLARVAEHRLPHAIRRGRKVLRRVLPGDAADERGRGLPAARRSWTPASTPTA